MSMSKPFNTSSLLCEESVSASNSSGKPESSFRKDGGLEERNDELVSDNLVKNSLVWCIFKNLILIPNA